MALSLIAAPATEPISLDEAKAHLRVSVTDDDALIEALIVAARERAEQETRRALITQTWDAIGRSFPGVIRLPKPPLESVTHVKYFDTANVEQTLSALTFYKVSAPAGADAAPGRISLRYGQVWPSVYAEEDVVTVRFVAGYGDAEDVPRTIKQGMLLAIGNWYANRETAVVGTIVADLPMGAKALWAAFDARTFGGTFGA